jgi:hypothetical protein
MVTRIRKLNKAGGTDEQEWQLTDRNLLDDSAIQGVLAGD